MSSDGGIREQKRSPPMERDAALSRLPLERFPEEGREEDPQPTDERELQQLHHHFSSMPSTYEHMIGFLAVSRREARKGRAVRRRKMGKITDSLLESAAEGMLQEEVRREADHRRNASLSQEERGIDDAIVQLLQKKKSLAEQMDAVEIQRVPLLSRQARQKRGRILGKKEILEILRVFQMVASRDSRISGLHLEGMNDHWASILAEHLREGVQCLRSISCVTQCSITNAGVKEIADAILDASTASSDNRLISLNFAGNSLSDAAAEALASVVRSPFLHLQCLNLAAAKKHHAVPPEEDEENNRIGPLGADALGKCLSSSYCQLKRLTLRGQPVGNSGGASIAQAIVDGNRSLEELYMSGCDIGDEAAVCFSSALQQTTSNLKILDLSRNRITTSGALSISSALRAGSKIICLDLSDNRIEEEGVLKLVDVVKVLPGLASLSLHGNFVDPKHSSLIELAIICSARGKATLAPVRWLTSRAAGLTSTYLPLLGGYVNCYSNSHFFILTLKEKTPSYAVSAMSASEKHWAISGDFFSRTVSLCQESSTKIDEVVQRARVAPHSSIISIQRDREAIMEERRALSSRDSAYRARKYAHIAASQKLSSLKLGMAARPRSGCLSDYPNFSRALPSLHPSRRRENR